MPAEDVTEFGGWPQPPRWVWVVAGFAAVAVLAGVLAARAGPRHVAPSACGPAVVMLPPIRGAQGAAAVAFSPYGKLLASSDSDGTVWLWNPATGQRVGTTIRTGARNGVPGVAFNPGGKLLASGDADGGGRVRLWNPAAGQPVGSAAPPPGQVRGWRTAPPGAGCWRAAG